MRKAEPAWSAPTSAGGPEDKGIFTFISWAEATRGANRCSWTEKSGYSKKNFETICWFIRKCREYEKGRA